MLNLRTGKNDLAPVALTRRDSIKGLAAILAAGCAPAIASAAARGAGGRVRGAAAAAAAAAVYRTAKSYVQNGLIAMWDGIENAGWGTHDASATVWKDLIGGIGDMTLVGTQVTFSSNAALWGEYTTGGVDYFYVSPYKSISNIQTVESCFYLPNRYGTIFGFFGSGIQLEFSGDTYVTTGYYSDAHSGSFDIPVNVKETVSLTTENTVSCFLNCIQKSRLGSGRYNGGAYNAIGRAGWLNAERYRIAAGGKIFNVRVYDVVLTAEQIAHNYAVDKVRFGLT